jgi:hypothetical protein
MSVFLKLIHRNQCNLNQYTRELFCGHQHVYVQEAEAEVAPIGGATVG